KTITLLLLILTHSLKYFETASSGVPNFPEFVYVGLVDELPISHYDSKTRRAEPKQDWMRRVTEQDPQYWKRETEKSLNIQQIYKGNIETAKQRFNETGGVHIFQRMYGCEWDDETGEVKGYQQYGFDGEDFLSYDHETESYIAPRQQAVITQQRWNNNKAWMENNKHYFTEECPEFLKKYVNYGRSSLMRTASSVSLLQKTPSSPVCCHATGLLPDHSHTVLEERWERSCTEDVDPGEILPNHDGSFQMSVDLKLSSVPAEDWRRYECVFQLSGVKDIIVTPLEEAVIRTNRGESSDTTIITIIIIGPRCGGSSGCRCGGEWLTKKRTGERPKRRWFGL
uniref:Ig-like domain-containing protein n=1 Tax=Cyclopterus lumpus TaxID=8103 RepID=A0A8C2WP57_CYCLU